MPPRRPTPDPDPRTRLVETVIDLIAERGLEAASVREVAGAAGVSIGAVQHHYPTKDAMLLAAFEATIESISGRVSRLRPTGTVRQNLSAALQQLLPLDPVREKEARVYLAFAARATVAPGFRALQARMLDDVLAAIQRVLADSPAYGGVPTPGDAHGDHADPSLDARILLALIDGLILQHLSAPRAVPRKRLVPALERTLESLIDPPVAR